MCDCIPKLNEMMAEHNTKLDELTMFSMSTGNTRSSLHVVTSKVDSRKKGKAKVMLVTFCPFCGERTAPQIFEKTEAA